MLGLGRAVVTYACAKLGCILLSHARGTPYRHQPHTQRLSNLTLIWFDEFHLRICSILHPYQFYHLLPSSIRNIPTCAELTCYTYELYSTPKVLVAASKSIKLAFFQSTGRLTSFFHCLLVETSFPIWPQNAVVRSSPYFTFQS